MVDNFVAGTTALFGDPFTVFIFICAVIGGMLFGAIPGVSMLTLAAIILPFTGALEPAQAIMLFAVIYCTGTYGGAITAILFNIPGSAENAPTAFDGYPMTQQGKAGKAVGAAVLCSAVGGVASALIMMSATETIANWAISNIAAPEIFALVFFGLAVASSVGGNTIWKGWLSVILGVMIGTVGQDPIDGVNRYTFGFTDLAAGIAFVPVILGLFAVSEVFTQAEKKAVGTYSAPKFSLNFPSILELWAEKIAVLRSILIGFFCGILPGIGATLAAFMSYGEAVRWSKKKTEFGRGKLEGVISSETANNAATGAAMIPLLALGLPGGALTAIMVAAFEMHDLEAGPLVFWNSPELIWVVFAAMFWANLSIFFIGLLETKTILYLLKIPFQFLAPLILLLATVGAFLTRGLVLDVMVMFTAGIVGFLMRRSGYSMAGLVLGVILGKVGERNFAQGMQMMFFEPMSFETGYPARLAPVHIPFTEASVSLPIGLLLLVGGVITLAFSVVSALRARPSTAS